jgi:hypothetical protein
MTPLEKCAIPLVITIASIAYVMSIVMPGEAFASHWLIREDGFLESLTALVLLAGAILCGYRCWKLRHERSRWFLRSMAACGAVLLFGMGEEISWGQRILGVQSPEFFLEHNAQDEMNLHNMMVGGTNINRLVFGKLLSVAVLLYMLLPVFYRGSRRIRRVLNAMAVPVPRGYQIAAILAVVLLVATSSARKRGEITEFAVGVLGVLVLVNPRNALIFRAQAAAAQREPRLDQETASAPSSHTEVDSTQPRRRAA